MPRNRPEGGSGAGSETRKRRCLGPTVAGTWYSAEPRVLSREIDGFLEQGRSDADPTPAVRGLIAPHAGLVYSGSVAGRGFAWLRDRSLDRVILLGPSHHAAFPGAALPDATDYRTPLGEVPIDIAAIESLRERTGFRVDDAPFQPEHCLEAEILFLQRALNSDWLLIPILIGAGTTADVAGAVADALRPLASTGTVVVVSSDFTHYGPQFRYVPFDDRIPQRLEELDMGAVDRILAVDPSGLAAYIGRTGATICGRDAIGVMLRMLPEAVRGSLVAYDTSGRMTGNWDHTVSYASVVFRDPPAEPPAP